MDDEPAPFVPDYDGGCLTNVVPALLADPGRRPAWLPTPAREATQVVLLVLDGLGWTQLRARAACAPVLSSLPGAAITSVVPTTTATGLTSIVTGTPPAEHGILGFSLGLGGNEVLNVLKWTTAAGDARHAQVPESYQVVAPFQGSAPPAVVRAEFLGSGFTRAHLGGSRLSGWRVPSTLVVEVRRALRAGERFVYAYYDGIDNVAHGYGLGEHYEAELRATDRLVEDLLSALPPGAVLVVTADHGQVDVGGRVRDVGRDLAALTSRTTGEPRFLWLRAADGVPTHELAGAAHEAHGEVAWVRTRDEVVEDGWFGGPIRPEWANRVGDVALAPFAETAFWDAERQGPLRLVSLHGSLTEDEMLVPLVAGAP